MCSCGMGASPTDESPLLKAMAMGDCHCAYLFVRDFTVEMAPAWPARCCSPPAPRLVCLWALLCLCRALGARRKQSVIV
jgi:hypothetical protein